MRMRPLLILLILALPGCQTMRGAAGAYSRFAEKGITVGSGPDAAQAEAAPAAPLAGGLASDGEKHVYAQPTPRSS